ncbi:hypothetical protein D9M70_446180 [compost metagenome]
MSNTEQTLPSRWAAMASNAPMVTTPVPPIPLTMMLNEPFSPATLGIGRPWISSPTWADFRGLRGSASSTVTKLGQKPLTQL